jgi:hypothetical protein
VTEVEEHKLNDGVVDNFQDMGQPDDVVAEINEYGERLPVSVVHEFQERGYT